MMILLIDNYDSFTYNIYQAFYKFGFPLKVVRSDKISIEEIHALSPQYIIIGPGPKTPKEAGISVQIVQELQGIYPILGICLGHQAIMAAFGMDIVNAKHIVHGKVEPLHHNQKGLFRNVNPLTPIVRYHSLVGKAHQLPECFEVSAWSEDGEIMAIEHKHHHLVGVQFHPESIGTLEGEKMLLNFLHYRREMIPIKQYLKSTMQGKSLSFKEAYDVMDEITEGNMSDAQIGSILTSLEIKGVNAEELAGFASVLKKKTIAFSLPKSDEIRLDIVGTGGSPNKTFNVSTTAALLLGAAGVKVVKHGNRAITSKSGSADLLQALGVNVNMDVQTCRKVYDEIGITFLFAQKFHAAMRFAAPARASLGFKTAFNLVGPLSNPANVTHQFIGVFDKAYTEIMAKALAILGIKRAMVVSGFDGYDEISLCAPTQITELDNGTIKTYVFNPNEIGLEFVPFAELCGGDVAENKRISLEIFHAKSLHSPKTQLVALNTGGALYLAGRAGSIKEGYFLARDIIESKKVLKVLEDFARLSHNK